MVSSLVTVGVKVCGLGLETTGSVLALGLAEMVLTSLLETLVL